MAVPVILSVLVLVGSVSLWSFVHGRLPLSFSEIATKEEIWKYVFAAVLLLFSGAVWVSCIDKIPDNWQWLLFLTVTGLLFVAATPITNPKSIGIHYGGAIAAGLCINFLTTLLEPRLLLLWSVYILYTLFSDSIYKKLLAEGVCAVILLVLTVTV